MTRFYLFSDQHNISSLGLVIQRSLQIMLGYMVYGRCETPSGYLKKIKN